MIATIITWLAKLGAGGVVDRAIALIDKRAELESDRESMRNELTAEYLRQVVEETRVMADYNKAKLSFPWFWLFASLFLLPLALWWAAVILDSVFNFPWSVADLPTSQMQTWAGNMIQWVFYVGSGVAGLKSVLKAGK